jgi:hypothetical protein
VYLSPKIQSQIYIYSEKQNTLNMLSSVLTFLQLLKTSKSTIRTIFLKLRPKTLSIYLSVSYQFTITFKLQPQKSQSFLSSVLLNRENKTLHHFLSLLTGTNNPPPPLHSLFSSSPSLSSSLKLYLLNDFQLLIYSYS